MANYVKNTNFASKDSLPTGDPLKIVKGTEIDSEFNSIATAVASKADSNSPSLLGTPTAPTAAAGTNNTQLATTAFVTTAMQALYPVGSIYINAGVTTNPATLLGFGTWTAFGAGKVLVGQDTGDSLFDVLEETGGSKDATLVSHSHTASVYDPGHSHRMRYTDISAYSRDFVANINDSAQGYDLTGYDGLNTSSSTTGISVNISSSGSSATDANLQPYVVVKMWKRTA